MQRVNVETIQKFIDEGRLVPSNSQMITMRDLVISGVISRVQDGVKLLSMVPQLDRMNVASNFTF